MAPRDGHRGYPAPITPVNHVEPVPRRIRGIVAGTSVLDTVRALYVWEWPYYPQYYVPLADIRPGALESEGEVHDSPQGVVEIRSLRVGTGHRRQAARVVLAPCIDGLEGTVRFGWAAMDDWLEEEERVFVHPRNPYVRVDALRSTRTVRVELDGTILGESSSPVMVFETGLPTRYYLNRTEVDFGHLIPSDTVSKCPYKGTTTGYWSIDIGSTRHQDLAWSYDFPTRELLAVAGMVAFYNERVTIVVDGRRLDQPTTHFFAPDQ